ncbi:MAG: M50 family metallopeptidase [Patescibacteria group bacterium]|jgi:regulator of sigma E protease
MTLALTIVLFVLIFGVVITLHELGHFLIARRENMVVREFAFGFPPRLWSTKRGATRYSVNAIPLGGYVSILGEDEASDSAGSFTIKSPWARLRVVLAGIAMNVLLAWLLITLYFWVAPLFPAPDAVVVAGVRPGSPAAAAGFKPNDFVKSANGTTFKTDKDLVAFTSEQAGQTVTFTVVRSGKEFPLAATLGGAAGGALGVTVVDVSEQQAVPWYQAPWYALKEIWAVTLMTLGFFGGLVAKLFGGGQGVSVDAVAGPVGIFSTLQQVMVLGIPKVIYFAGHISLAVGLFNALPVPALDGGRAMFLLFEGIFGKKALRPETEGWIHAIGFILLIGVIVLVTVIDVQRLG